MRTVKKPICTYQFCWSVKFPKILWYTSHGNYFPHKFVKFFKLKFHFQNICCCYIVLSDQLDIIMSGQRALFSLHIFFTQEISSTMTHHLANSLKQDVLHILPALKIYFSLHIWNFSAVHSQSTHSPSSSSFAPQHQCSKLWIRDVPTYIYRKDISKQF